MLVACKKCGRPIEYSDKKRRPGKGVCESCRKKAWWKKNHDKAIVYYLYSPKHRNFVEKKNKVVDFTCIDCHKPSSEFQKRPQKAIRCQFCKYRRRLMLKRIRYRMKTENRPMNQIEKEYKERNGI